MNGQLPRLHQDRDGEKQIINKVNQLSDQLPGNAWLMLPVGPFNMLTTGQTLCVPANVPGWNTVSIDFIPTITGSQSGAPIVRVGYNATFDNIVALTNLGTTLTSGQPTPLLLAAVPVGATVPIYIDVQTAATGPTSFTGKLYLGGYYS